MRLDQLTKPRHTNWSVSLWFSRTENSPGPSTLLLNPTSTTYTYICFHDAHVAFLLYSNIIKDVKCHNTHLWVQQIISSPFFLLTSFHFSDFYFIFPQIFFINLIHSLLHYSVRKPETLVLSIVCRKKIRKDWILRASFLNFHNQECITVKISES